jgi:hypothetical protein
LGILVEITRFQLQKILGCFYLRLRYSNIFEEKKVGLHFGLHFLQTHLITLLWTRVAGFFLTQYTKTGENIPKIATKLQMAKKYT